MCVVSAVFDRYYDRWNPNPLPPFPGTDRTITFTPTFPTAEEIAEFRDLLEKARKWDIEHGEPDCEMEEKRKKLLDLADELGVEIDFI